MAEIICSICGTKTSKGKTYALGNGTRACRAHEGVTEKMQQLQDAEKAKREATAAAARKRLEEYRQREQEQTESFMKPRCWCCRKTGIQEQEFYLRLLIAGEKLDMQGQSVSPFDPTYREKMRTAIGLVEGEAVISILPLKGNEHVVQKMRHDLRALPSMVQVVALCQECIDQHKAVRPVNKLIENKDSLVTAMVAYDLVRPAIRLTALKEILEQENAEVSSTSDREDNPQA